MSESWIKRANVGHVFGTARSADDDLEGDLERWPSARTVQITSGPAHRVRHVKLNLIQSQINTLDINKPPNVIQHGEKHDEPLQTQISWLPGQNQITLKVVRSYSDC